MTRYFITFSFLVSFALLPLGVGAQETSGGFSGGSVLVGYDNRTCDGTLEGAIRYNSAISSMEYCDGTSWTAPGIVGGGLGCSGPADCATAGDVCTDGSVFAGCSGGNAFYVTRCDFDDTWGGSSCSGTTGNQYWANDSSSTNLRIVGVTDVSDGRANTTALTNGVVDGTGDSKSTAGLQIHQAAQFCADLSMHGKTDWYLPSQAEGYVMYLNSVAIGNFSATKYWVSSENGANAWTQNFAAGGFLGGGLKNGARPVRCARR